ncbi:YeeE/YedE family protein [Thiohalorhabdus methylotrophus]|uniref:YeeE/YedE family protein n=1 Tax=Thiohalorhabdus methylotrophus TaxID=3242694 RepID=A0ABV4TXA4_9GAMM
MDLSLTQQILLWGFLVAVVIGAVANKTNFCTMGAVSDWVNINDTGRMRSWLFAMAVAITGVLIMGMTGVMDPAITADGNQTFPPYRTANFAWPRYLLGGLLFGVGMTLGSGCGNKTLVRIGGGNIKSVVVLAFLGLGAYLMMFNTTAQKLLIVPLQPASFNFAAMGAPDQSLGGIVGALLGVSGATMNYVLGAMLVIGLLAFVFKSVDFRARFNNILGGAVIGLGVLAAWFVTAGPLGKKWMEELMFAVQPPVQHAAAQSYTFVSPAGDLGRWITGGFGTNLLSFGLMALAGVVVGSLVWALVSRTFRFEWFASWKDAGNHVIGGFLMGIGGVMGMGCTIGQGVTGISTLALGSFLTFGSIVIGAALTMKIQYYKLVYEEEATFGKALVAGLADMKLLPNGMRSLEQI